MDVEPKVMYKLYKSATKSLTDFFMIDLQTTDEKMRFRKSFEPISADTEALTKKTKVV